MRPREVISKLKKNGWELKRINGSHHIFEKDGNITIVGFHGSKDVKKPVIKAIEKQTGIKLL